MLGYIIDDYASIEDFGHSKKNLKSLYSVENICI